MRREIEKILDIKAYDIYGLSEIAGPGVSFECKEQTGMHINEDFFYPEIIDPKTGEQLPDGEYGELVFTCIGKEALPLLRYRTRDICKLSHKPCSCGRTLVKMSKTRGRTDDMLIIRGINVFPSQVEHVLLELIAKRLDKGSRRVVLHLPYDKGGLLDALYREAKVESVEYKDTIEVTAVCTPRLLGQLEPYLQR